MKKQPQPQARPTAHPGKGRANTPASKRLTAFGQFMAAKYREWRHAGLRRDPDLPWSQVDWASELGISQSLISYYIRGQRLPRNENVEYLALRLGDELYDVLGLERPDRDLQFIIEHWAEVPKAKRQELLRAIAAEVQSAAGAHGTEGGIRNVGLSEDTGTDEGAAASGRDGVHRSPLERH